MSTRLYRGKCIKGKQKGKWVYGVPITVLNGECWIIESVSGSDGTNCYEGEMSKVDPDSVGQCTDVPDTSATKIFEGDVIESIVKYCDGSEERYRGVVRFVDGIYVLCSKDDIKDITDMDYPLGYFGRVVAKSQHDVNVIGNIYDNPELLEERNDE